MIRVIGPGGWPLYPVGVRILVLLSVLLLVLPGLAETPADVVGEDSEVPVTASDSLYSVARAHRLALEHLAFANRMAPDLRPLKPGRLALPGRRVLPQAPPTDGLVLNLPERGLFLFRHGRFVDFYPVAIGMPGWNTPVGSYRIASRVVDPTWSPPAWAGVGGPVGPGPHNPLGDRWMGLSRAGYGIHSTNVPSSIGGAVSHGCIRMYPEMARELFDRVVVGMPVRIEYEPVKLGLGPDGRIFLAVFPDVYSRSALLAEAERRVNEAGLGALVDRARLRAIVARPTGLAEPLVGEELRLVLGEEEQPGRFLAARIEGRLYVTPELLAAAGLSAQEAEGHLLVGRDDRVMEVAGSIRWEHRWFVPAVPVLANFGWRARLDGPALVLTREELETP